MKCFVSFCLLCFWVVHGIEPGPCTCQTNALPLTFRTFNQMFLLLVFSFQYFAYFAKDQFLIWKNQFLIWKDQFLSWNSSTMRRFQCPPTCDNLKYMCFPVSACAHCRVGEPSVIFCPVCQRNMKLFQYKFFVFSINFFPENENSFFLHNFYIVDSNGCLWMDRLIGIFCFYSLCIQAYLNLYILCNEYILPL